jgi:hypothetical protein
MELTSGHWPRTRQFWAVASTTLALRLLAVLAGRCDEPSVYQIGGPELHPVLGLLARIKPALGWGMLGLGLVEVFGLVFIGYWCAYGRSRVKIALVFAFAAVELIGSVPGLVMAAGMGEPNGYPEVWCGTANSLGTTVGLMLVGCAVAGVRRLHASRRKHLARSASPLPPD